MRKAIPKIQTADSDLNRVQDNILAALNPLLKDLDPTGSPATSGASLGLPTGAVLPFAGSSAPPGYLLCDGAAVSRATYSALYAVVGIVYGAGDGATTFNVPDLRGRVAVGAGQGAGLTERSAGASGGEEAHALTEAELASHNHGGATSTDGSHQHTYSLPTAVIDAAEDAFAGGNNDVDRIPDLTDAQGSHSHTISSAGSGTAHNTMPPFLALNQIIKT